MRRVLAVGLAFAFLLGGTGAVLAATGGRHHSDQGVNRQAAAWTTAKSSAPADWSLINWDAIEGSDAQPGAEPITVTADGTIVVTVSAVFAGGAVDLRVIEGGRHVMRPGPVRFDPQPGSRSFSFTFVRHGGHPACGRNVSVQWRRSADAPTTMSRADAVVTYKRDTTDHSGVGCA
jgi:hypothetical protein